MYPFPQDKSQTQAYGVALQLSIIYSDPCRTSPPGPFHVHGLEAAWATFGAAVAGAGTPGRIHWGPPSPAANGDGGRCSQQKPEKGGTKARECEGGSMRETE